MNTNDINFRELGYMHYQAVTTCSLEERDIFFLLISGYYSGKIMRSSLKLFFISKISNIVLLLLVCMGGDFRNVFTDKDIGYSVIQNSMAFSAILALITFFFSTESKRRL